MAFHSPILVTGSPRSGTSLIAGVISICGAFPGRVDRMKENVRIREKIIKPFMITQRLDHTGQVLSPANELQRVELIAQPRFFGILKIEGWDMKTPWMYKDCRTAVLSPVWARMFPDGVFVLVRRDRAEIVNSCVKTGYMAAYSDPGDWGRMVQQYEARMELIKQSGVRWVEIYPTEAIHGDFRSLKRLIEVLGLHWEEEKVLDYIKPKHWREL
jgi:hypothetical protein